MSSAPAGCVVATAGHVDHGKSSLVRALTGTDPDRFAEEQRRGMTIDLGFAHLRLPSGREIGFVDVPGHVRFVANMLAGVGGAAACLLVVDATEGWRPQSEEHLRILELLGTPTGVIAITKADLVDDDGIELAHLDVADHVRGTFLDRAPVVAVSAVTGAGLDELVDVLGTVAMSLPAGPDDDRPRLWIDRSFSARGAGTVVTGTLTGGTLHVDDQLHVVPAGVPVRVRALQSHGTAYDEVGPGRRVAVNLVGVDHRAVRRGDALVRVEQWRPTRRADASLAVLATLDHAVSRRGAHVAHIGSGEWPVRVRVLGPETLAPGEPGFVRLHLAAELPLVRGDRFVLRESGRGETVGGGEILDVRPVRPASRARPDRSIERLVAEHGWISAADLTALTGERVTPTVDEWVVAPAALDATRSRVRELVDAAGPLGLDVATLDARERAVLATLEAVRVDRGRATPAAVVDPLATHPLVARLEAAGLAPPVVDDVDRATIRELVRRGLLWEREGLLFHPAALDVAARAAAQLLRAHPEGITVSALREVLGITRKHAVPLAAELDARAITRRRGDLRIAGPRLPTIDA